MLLLGLHLAWLYLQRTAHPEKHPLMQALARYGQPNDVAMQIDSELRSEPNAAVTNDVRLTINWLIHATAFNTVLMQARDVIWAYQKITKHYHNGISTGKSYATVIRDSRGQTTEVTGKKTVAPELVNTLQQRLPWIVAGFTKELEELWNKNRAKFIEAVEKRRENLTAVR